MVRRLLITVNAGLVALCLAAVGSLGWAVWRVRTAPRVELPPGVLEARPDPGTPFNLLLVGSDSREGLDGQRADVILLVRVDPAAGSTTLLSIPRDLWVRVDPAGTMDRVNAAFGSGPAGLIAAIEDNFGIPVNHYAQVDFEGFRGLVDALGGVRIPLAHPVRDRDEHGVNKTGLEIMQTGCVELGGEAALAYVRSRHYEELVDGEWVADVGGDRTRIARQQDFLRRAADQVGTDDLLNPLRLQRLVDVALDHLEVDDRLDYDEAFDLARRLAGLDPAAVAPGQLPADDEKIDGKWVLVLRAEEAEPLLAPFRGGPEQPAPSPVDPSPSSTAPVTAPVPAAADPCH